MKEHENGGFSIDATSHHGMEGLFNGTDSVRTDISIRALNDINRSADAAAISSHTVRNVLAEHASANVRGQVKSTTTDISFSAFKASAPEDPLTAGEHIESELYVSGALDADKATLDYKDPILNSDEAKYNTFTSKLFEIMSIGEFEEVTDAAELEEYQAELVASWCGLRVTLDMSEKKVYLEGIQIGIGGLKRILSLLKAGSDKCMNGTTMECSVEGQISSVLIQDPNGVFDSARWIEKEGEGLHGANKYEANTEYAGSSDYSGVFKLSFKSTGDIRRLRANSGTNRDPEVLMLLIGDLYAPEHLTL